MDGRVFHTVLAGFLLFIIACYGNDEKATFCLSKSKTLNPPINCPRECAPVILITEAKSQIMSDCSANSSSNNWKLNDTASHMVWNSCNLRGSSCMPITYHDDSAVRLEVVYTCVNLLSLHKQDLCSNVGFVMPTPFYLHTPGYPNVSDTTTQTNCTCRLLTASGSDVTLTLLDMLSSLPESLRIEWNGGREDIKTVSDEVGHVAAQRSVTNKDMMMIFTPRFPGGSVHMWIRVEAQVNATPEAVLLTCNGDLGNTPTGSPTISPSLCPTTTTTTTTTTTASTTTELPTTTTTAPKATTNRSTTQTTTGPSQAPGAGSGFSIYYLVPVIVIVITIIILVAVLVIKKTRRERLEDVKPVTKPIKLTRVQVDGNVFLTSGRPTFILGAPGGRAATHSHYKALELSPKELGYFDPPKTTDTLNSTASRSSNSSVLS